jgi:hypothetical protein
MAIISEQCGVIHLACRQATLLDKVVRSLPPVAWQISRRQRLIDTLIKLRNHIKPSNSAYNGRSTHDNSLEFITLDCCLRVMLHPLLLLYPLHLGCCLNIVANVYESSFLAHPCFAQHLLRASLTRARFVDHGDLLWYVSCS